MDSTSCTWCTCSLPYSAHILLLHYTPLYTALKLINILYLSILLYIPSFTYLSSTILNNILYLFSPILHYTPLYMVVMFHNVLCMPSTIFHFLQYLLSIYCTHAQLHTVPVLKNSPLYIVPVPLFTLYSSLFTVPGFLFTLNLCSTVIHYIQLYTVTVLYFTGFTPFDSVFVIHDKPYLWRT